MRAGFCFALVGCTVAAAACSASHSDSARPALDAGQSSPATELTFPGTPVGDAARRGLAILTNTKDSLPEFVGNGLRCTSCHLDGGRRPHAMPWTGVQSRYPQFRSRAGRVLTIEDRIDECFERSLAGKALPHDDDRLRAIESYFLFISAGTTIGQRTPGQGIDSVRASVPDTGAGERVFVSHCARCHGSDGSGGVHDASGVNAPPVWGAQSFTIGAGMGRYLSAAGYVWRNMPFDTPGTLTEQQALDVAAYIDAQARPDYAAKEHDWPAGHAPKDVPYKLVR
jgi:thiosulfate dehydrogenase